ncbi:MAG: hypothetical protein LLF75_03370 [Eubacteriales bacterium]|nr:hypothetical protein [Eubacteriales bacterium]
MQEWDVVSVIAALAALFGFILAPIIKLTQAITRLTATMENLKQSVEELSTSNHAAHESIWQFARGQETRLSDHETRIRVMEDAR